MTAAQIGLTEDVAPWQREYGFSHRFLVDGFGQMTAQDERQARTSARHVDNIEMLLEHILELEEQYPLERDGVRVRVHRPRTTRVSEAAASRRGTKKVELPRKLNEFCNLAEYLGPTTRRRNTNCENIRRPPGQTI